MKKIHLALLIAIVLAGGILLYPRGGGGSPNPKEDLIYGWLIPAKLKSPALPDACTEDMVLNPLNEPQSVAQLPTACTVKFPDSLQVIPYCVNKATHWGGANITIPSLGEYLNLPKNCTVLVDDEKLYSKTVVCSGPAGSMVKLTVENSCTPSSTTLPEEVEPYCPPNFPMNEFGICQFTAPPNSPLCSAGYQFDSSSNCCRKILRNMFSSCPVEYHPHQTWKPAAEESKWERGVTCVLQNKEARTTDTRSYTITLGTCDGQKPKEDSAPAPCTLDPLTGMCK